VTTKPPSYGGPRKRRYRKPEGSQIPTIIPQEQISFNKYAFDEMIRSMGVRLMHYRAIPDPTGMASRGDGHPSQDDHGVIGPGGSGGYLFQEAGCVQAFFQANNTSEPLEPLSVISNSTAYITLPTHYENGEDAVMVSEYDRFYLLDIEVRVVGKQFVEASATGTDRLQYPATCVEYIADAKRKNVDGAPYRYVENQDFRINADGTITWISQNQPGQDPGTGKGVVYSVRYRYVPFFIVISMPHEVRVAQITDQATYDRKLERMPYQVHAVREKVFQDLNRLQQQTNGDLRLQYPAANTTLAPPVPAPGGALGPAQGE
jgi:hypothetical protein